MAVFATTDRLIVIDELTVAETGKDQGFLGMEVRRNKEQD